MSEVSEQTAVRKEKLGKLVESGWNYPNKFGELIGLDKVSDSACELRQKEMSEESRPRFEVCGRVVQLRKMGKAAFFHIQDQTGKLQVYIRKDSVSEEDFAAFKALDIGDIVYLSGFPFLTKTDEPSLHAEKFQVLVKSLHPLPEKFHGLADIEMRYRRRYLDLIVNPEVRNSFVMRSKIIAHVRNFFDKNGYIEVETPTMSSVSSGAAAKPFKTHHNALGLDLNMRIALELPLKRLVVGGIERVYEIGRVFRNEGLSPHHNPEFTMIEFYQAYATHETLMDLTEQLVQSLCDEVVGKSEFDIRGQNVSLKGPWKRITMRDAVLEASGDPSADVNSLEGIHAIAKKLNCELALQEKSYGRALFVLFDEAIADTIVSPTFVTEFPKEVSPLARPCDSDPNFVDRFELFVAGMELANAFSELNDPEDQRARFEDQVKRKGEGDDEAMEYDDDFILSLEYGLPPTAGEGIGIDRLVMILTEQPTIRDVILFPVMRPNA